MANLALHQYPNARTCTSSGIFDVHLFAMVGLRRIPPPHRPRGPPEGSKKFLGTARGESCLGPPDGELVLGPGTGRVILGRKPSLTRRRPR